MSSDLLTICCVLKSGGDFSPIYVKKLREQIRKVTVTPFRFICFTDFPDVEGGIGLEFNYPGWWSKLEIFKLRGPTIYFDLDTIIIGNFENDLYSITNRTNFYMLSCFNPNRKFASGIMAWNGDYSFLLKDFKEKSDIEKYDWDQYYIIDKIGEENINFLPFQKGVYSYKHHCREKLPPDTSIVCFHGKPRPHEIQNGWPLKYWK